MSTPTAPLTWQDALATLELHTTLSPEVEAALELVRNMAQDPVTPVTRYAALTHTELECAMVEAAYELEEAQREYLAAQGAIDAICDRHPRLTRRMEDLETLQIKVADLKQEIAKMKTEIVPGDFVQIATEQGAIVDEKREALGYLLTEFYERFPSTAPSDARLGFVESEDGLFAVHLRKSAEADWKVSNPRRFFGTLPMSHKDMLNVTITTNTKLVSRKELKEWLTVQQRLGAIDGIEKGARIIHFMKDEGSFCTLERLPEDFQPVRSVKLNW